MEWVLGPSRWLRLLLPIIVLSFLIVKWMHSYLLKLVGKKVHCKSNNMLLSHFCNTVLLLLSRERNGQVTLCSLAEEWTPFTKSQGFWLQLLLNPPVSLRWLFQHSSNVALEAACFLKSPGFFVSLLVYIACNVTERNFLAGGRLEAHAFLPVFLKIWAIACILIDGKFLLKLRKKQTFR